MFLASKSRVTYEHMESCRQNYYIISLLLIIKAIFNSSIKISLSIDKGETGAWLDTSVQVPQALFIFLS